jgi:hypothetical protein
LIDHFWLLLFGIVGFVGSLFLAVKHENTEILVLFCLIVPLGFLNNLYEITARPNEFNALFVLLGTLIGFGVGWLAQVITQWKPKALWLIAILLILNSCGFIWYIIQFADFG